MNDGIDVLQFRNRVLLPVLGYLSLPGGDAVVNLLLGTAAQESQFRSLAQKGGPALGLFQMEPRTHDDIFANFLAYRSDLRARADALACAWPEKRMQLVTNLAYAAAMARIHYLRAPDPLPRADDPDQLGRYWKTHYNTPDGAGSVAEFVGNYRRLVAPIVQGG